MGNDRWCGPCCRNPAYEGKACYGKTEQSPRQRITDRFVRKKRHFASNQLPS